MITLALAWINAKYKADFICLYLLTAIIDLTFIDAILTLLK